MNSFARMHAVADQSANAKVFRGGESAAKISEGDVPL